MTDCQPQLALAFDKKQPSTRIDFASRCEPYSRPSARSNKANPKKKRPISARVILLNKERCFEVVVPARGSGDDYLDSSRVALAGSFEDFGDLEGSYLWKQLREEGLLFL